MKYSLLDLFPVEEGTPASHVIHASARVAQAAERLGYERYWVAEHHNMPGIASAAPEVLIGFIASQTQKIRVGAGGIMLPNHAPLHVLEVFRTLEALYTGRIDLGIGRAPGTDPVTSSALQRGHVPVNQQIAELAAFMRGQWPDGHPFEKIVAMPNDVAPPPLWMLGSTHAGAEIAATLGVGFAFAGHFSMDNAERALATYHAQCDETKKYTILALSVVCAETDEEADELAEPMRMVVARMLSGKTGTFPSVKRALEQRQETRRALAGASMARHMIVGSQASVKRQLEEIAARFRPNELMISTNIADVEKRIRSYELVATA